MQLILSEFTPLALSLCSRTLGGSRARAAPALHEPMHASTGSRARDLPRLCMF